MSESLRHPKCKPKKPHVVLLWTSLSRLTEMRPESHQLLTTLVLMLGCFLLWPVGLCIAYPENYPSEALEIDGLDLHNSEHRIYGERIARLVFDQSELATKPYGLIFFYDASSGRPSRIHTCQFLHTIASIHPISGFLTKIENQINQSASVQWLQDALGKCIESCRILMRHGFRLELIHKTLPILLASLKADAHFLLHFLLLGSISQWSNVQAIPSNHPKWCTYLVALSVSECVAWLDNR